MTLPRAAKIRLTGSHDGGDGFQYGLRCEVDGKELPCVTAATVVFESQEYAKVTLTLAADVEIDDVLGANIIFEAPPPGAK